MYGIELYGHASKSVLKPLQIIQNKAIKSLFAYPYDYPSKLLFNELRIVNIKTMYKIRAATMVNALLTQPRIQNIHLLITEYCTLMSHKYNTRDKNKFNLKYKKPSYSQSDSFKLFLLWNSIPVYIRDLNNILLFKQSIKHLFCTQALQ
jgi:hypothetical protein